MHSYLSIALGVLQEVQQETTRLFGPARLSTRDLVLLTLRMTTSVLVEAPEGDGILVLDDVVQELLRALQGHALQGLGRLTRVLYRDEDETKRDQRSTQDRPAQTIPCETQCTK